MATATAGLDAVDVDGADDIEALEDMSVLTDSCTDSATQDLFDGVPIGSTLLHIGDTIRELTIWKGGNCDLTTALTRVGTNIAVTQGYALGVATIGAVVGIAILPGAGTYIGWHGGRFLGRQFGRQEAKAERVRPLNEAIAAYNAKVYEIQQIIAGGEQVMRGRLQSVVAEELENYRIATDAVHQECEQMLREIRAWLNQCCARFVELVPEIAHRVSEDVMRRVDDELKNGRHSWFLRRLLWPTSSDVRRSTLLSAKRSRVRRLARLARHYRRVSRQIYRTRTPEDALQSLKRALFEQQMQSPTLDKLTRQLAAAGKTASLRRRQIHQLHRVRTELCKLRADERLTLELQTASNYLQQIWMPHNPELQQLERIMKRRAAEVGVSFELLAPQAGA